MKTIVVGIMPQEKIRERMLSIARGEFKPKSTDPKIWFTSMRSLACPATTILSGRRQLS
jgi:predicted transcriptional regulator